MMCHIVGQLVTFDKLPDDVLLEIFDFYAKDFLFTKRQGREKWITLVHVCRRWRSLVFQSPHRLNLRLVCTSMTRARDTLDIWPPLPLVIDNNSTVAYEKADNIIAALEHNDRVCQIDLSLMTSKLESVTNSAAMQKPFPGLTGLQLTIHGPQILPDSSFGGTAPRLRSLHLCGVPFLGLPKLLSTTTHLVVLGLFNIPRSGYIPPEVMASSLSALTSLEFLSLHFRYPRPRRALGSPRQTLPPLTRSILPSLAQIQFKGASEYLEVILARIDAPLLNKLHITFSNQIIFDTPQLFQFISQRPTPMAPEEGCIKFNSRTITVKFRSRTSDFRELRVRIPSTASEWQLSFLEKISVSPLPPLSRLEDLYIRVFSFRRPRGQDEVDYMIWLGLLRPFVAVKNLYLPEKFMRGIAPTLQELDGGSTAEVFPTLANIFLEGLQPSEPLHEDIEKFVAARRLTNHPVTVSCWVLKQGLGDAGNLLGG
jgi:hypothetical protein